MPLDLAEASRMFGTHGFVVIRGLFTPEEVSRLSSAYHTLVHRSKTVLRTHCDRLRECLSERPDGINALVLHTGALVMVHNVTQSLVILRDLCNVVKSTK